MDPSLKIVVILTIGFGFASFFAYIAQMIKLPPILGYLLAGYLIGPYSPGFVADLTLSHQLAEIGVILMLFGVGLHFKITDLMMVKEIALLGATGQTIVATLLTTALITYLGWPIESGIVMGLAIGVASTVVLIRVLSDNRLLHTPEGHIAIGWLVVEDIFTVIVLILLPAMGVLQNGGPIPYVHLLGAMAIALGKFLILILVMFTWGHKIVFFILAPVARLRSHELFTITILALVFLIAAGSTALFGTSIALGAFIAGMVVGKTSARHQAAANALPLKEIFSVIFFLSVGMLFNPAAITANPAMFLGCLAVILVAKPLVAFLISRSLGYSFKVALTLAVSLAQIGEFSFILAEAASKWNILPGDGYDILVGCALVSISINPLLFQLLNFFESKVPPHSRTTPQPSEVVIVGFTSIGKEITKELKEHATPHLIIDQNIDTVLLKEEQEAIIFGDASQADILSQAHVEGAKALLITLPDIEKTLEIIRQARHLNPLIRIIACVYRLIDKPLLKGLNVDSVCTEEEGLKALRKLL